MDYVTITDHNKIDGAMILKDKYPHDVFTGVESTAYFPEDKCKIHVLIYGLTDIQFEVINHIRSDIYDLREYLRTEKLVHSVAHASYSVNGRLSKTHLEKLILLFDYFESINGGRNKKSNLGWEKILLSLDENRLEDLYRKYRIEPFGQDSWIKGYTGGSDDHGGLFLGKTYTQARAGNVEDFLSAIASKKNKAVGRHNSFHALAFTVYKIAYDFSKQNGSKKNKPSLLGTLTENLFENRNLDIRNRIRIKTMQNVADWHGDKLKLCLGDLVSLLQENRKQHIEDKLDAVYLQISNICDTFFVMLLNSLEEDLKELNLVKIIRNISSSLPGIFLLLPFFSSLKHMHHTLSLVEDLRKEYQIREEPRKRRTLWFTDTINDLNGVSVTLKQMGQIAYERGRDIRIVSSLADNEITDEIPESFLNLPYMYVFRLPYYENYRIKIPSILSCIKTINDYEPDQIIISTPGPIGLLALLAAKLIHVPVIGIYHTDFSGEAKHIVPDESGSTLILEYERWFYNQMDEIRTPTREYRNILLDRGIHATKMGLLRRGIETDRFAPCADRKDFLKTKHNYREGITLLYAGRVSKDKSLDLLVDIYKRLVQTNPDLNLVIAGNGPYLSEMKALLADYQGVIFTGAVPRNILPRLYNAADYFVFNSITDTYGMVILESQACGLPAIVSNHGGPKEIILDNESGFVVLDQKLESWIKVLEKAMDIYRSQPDFYAQMRSNSRARVMDSSDWDAILDDILGKDFAEE